LQRLRAKQSDRSGRASMEKQAGSVGGKARVAEAVTRRWWPLRSRATMMRTLPAVCVVAAVTAAAVVLTTGGWGSSPNEMPTSSFFDGTLHYKQHNALRRRVCKTR